jgi:hypothetical protein
MKFKIGKFYKHTCGSMMAIVGEAQTTMWGNCLVAEEASSGENHQMLKPVGRDETAAVNWTEIKKEEWMKNFS